MGVSLLSLTELPFMKMKLRITMMSPSFAVSMLLRRAGGVSSEGVYEAGSDTPPKSPSSPHPGTSLVQVLPLSAGQVTDKDVKVVFGINLHQPQPEHLREAKG